MKRPSRAKRESATTILKNGRFLAPPRASRITTMTSTLKSEARDFTPVIPWFAREVWGREAAPPSPARVASAGPGRAPAVTPRGLFPGFPGLSGMEHLIEETHDHFDQFVFLALEEMQGVGDDDLLRTGYLVDLAFAFVGAHLGDLPVLAAKHVQHRDLYAEHFFQAVDDADEHPGLDRGFVGLDQILVGHGRAQAVRNDGNAAVALLAQEFGGQFVAFRPVSIGGKVIADLCARPKHRQLDRKRGVAGLRKLDAQGAVELEGGVPAATVTDDDGTARLLGLGVQRQEFVTVFLLQPDRLADQDRGQNLVRPAFLALVVHRQDGGTVREQHDNGNQPSIHRERLSLAGAGIVPEGMCELRPAGIRGGSGTDDKRRKRRRGASASRATRPSSPASSSAARPCPSFSSFSASARTGRAGG